MKAPFFVLLVLITAERSLCLPLVPNTDGGPTCPGYSWNFVTYKCYRLLTAVRFTWQQARDACQEFAAQSDNVGDLVSIHSGPENKYIGDTVAPPNDEWPTWIGLKSSAEGELTWSDDSLMDLVRVETDSANRNGSTATNENKERCGQFMSSQNDKWRLVDCDEAKLVNVVCQLLPGNSVEDPQCNLC
ncbi:echinoidin-like isoform 1 [Aphelenchoides avenae]|nr:echinoidin-like isoform 1 [Aphelenchus avenae]